MLKELIEQRKALDLQFHYIQILRLAAVRGDLWARGKVLDNFDELSEFVRILCDQLSFIENQIFILQKCNRS
jgi:hypothetical protein